jgi:Tfp pilus assembly protein PilN
VRPVNLIPQEERAASGGTGSSGVIGYVIIGFLVVAIAIVTYITSLGNKIDEHKSDIASLQGQVEQSQARASALQPYVELANVRAARTATIDSLAKSRFDWERVLRELAKITTPAISLSNLTGTVAPDVDVEGAADVSLRDQVPGPALEITGCATSQRTLADFVAALHDIDGVTRVAAESSAKGDKLDKEEGATADQAATSQSSSECARPKDTSFQLVAAFDAVPTPSEAASGTTGSTTVTATGTTDDGGVAAEQASQATQQQQIDNASQQSQDAANLTPGG